VIVQRLPATTGTTNAANTTAKLRTTEAGEQDVG